MCTVIVRGAEMSLSDTRETGNSFMYLCVCGMIASARRALAVADLGGVRGVHMNPPLGMDLVLRTTDDRLS